MPELLGCGLDVLPGQLGAVEALLQTVEERAPSSSRERWLEVDAAIDGLDVLVNNACQTVRRPPQYYAQTVA